MLLDLDDTIVAIASAPGGALRGIVRLSGAASAACAASIFRAGDPLRVASPTVLTGALTLPHGLGTAGRFQTCPTVPARLYVWPDNRSYTRQPAVELHTLGSPPLLEAVVESLCKAGARLARPGEFTLRAFLAGRLDLTQAEAVLGVIDARGEAQLDAALTQLAGGLAAPLAALRERLLDLLAHLEAGLDFVDEDIEFITPAELETQLAAVAGQVQKLSERMRSRHDTSEQPRVVLVGPPNAGKSSLLNTLAGTEAAIVADEAGTTRDYVTCRLAAEGQEFVLVDTAGVAAPRDAGSVAEQAQSATDRQRRDADVVVVCRDVQAEGNDQAGAFRCAHAPYGDAIEVWTKCDLASPPAERPGLRTSSRTGEGIDALKHAIAVRLREQAADAALVHTAARCGESLDLAAAALARAGNLAARGAGDELVAAEVRTALVALGEVAGAVYTDDVLDRVFSRFCIGK
jgi:tRNA modification GTPase